MRRALLTVLAVLSASTAACGGDEKSASTPTATATPTPAATTDPRAEDEQALKELGDRYVAAIAAGDFGAVCKLLAPNVQRRWERRAGSCEAVYRETQTARSRRGIRDVRTKYVTVKGDQAALAMGAKDVAQEYATYYAVKVVGGEWRITLKRYAGKVA